MVDRDKAPPAPPPAAVVRANVATALAEDLGSGDASAALLDDLPARAWVLCREAAVIAGRPWFDACFEALDPAAQISWRVAEGQQVAAGSVLCTIAARTRALLSAERSALNFLQLLSATATTTAAHAAVLAGSSTRLLDTRKTLPGLRLAQKYAVRCGGGHNHRLGLYDAVMLKENHIAAAGSIGAAVARARARFPALPLIIEVESLPELDEALAAGCDRILLDDFDADSLREAVLRAGGRVPLEVSGGVAVDRLPQIAASGVDCVSVGALTKHLRAIDLSLRLGDPPG
ncbi:carboxylating nicotinate-nucleotide diphosphorylase [Silanimonas sp.]|uniref:carboxylating nicotinate-nucleotide diphosphorylase n=1 Tax=Silanimonas sp. TaxID=1929290 RepID=UPI001BBC6403|nr:carboxylating nicotinate-nucleotide diphosphorylase [Silanimonas sp.]MBS3897053.1 carboxylating nicotinate-nucleotide diphosphorylase [Silanimonas sp.]MBS3923997.1 carboxylating nicotinate-nucleotide diphosphorylase [Xanthomonadaceae bacterium]